MAKDPAFLFYPNDWLGGTMGMSFEEKGAYMDVLMMQFNRGHMTEDMIGRTVGQLWVNIKHKFSKDDAGLWYNERLDAEKIKRQSYVQSRFNNKSGKNQYPKKEGHTTTHMTVHMEDENIDIDNKGGMGEKEEAKKAEKEPTIEESKKHFEDMVVMEMMKIWKQYNPTYMEEKENDYPACLQIVYKIASIKKWKQYDVLNGKMPDALKSWEIICAFIKTDSFYRKLPLETICSKWQGLMQTMDAKKKELQEPIKKQDKIERPDNYVTEADLAKYRKTPKNV